MTQPKKRRLLLYGRIILGIASFCVFAILGVSAVLTHTMPERLVVLTLLLVGAILMLPRRVRPIETEETDAEQAAEHAASIQRWLTWIRIAFFLVAAFVFVVLPELVENAVVEF